MRARHFLSRKRSLLRSLAGGAAIGGCFALLAWAELQRPLRPGGEAKHRRLARNLTVAAASAATIRLIEQPVAMRAAHLAERRRLGLVRRLPLGRAGRAAAALLLMDYTLYVWHVLTHRVPWLWRFHQVHHVDRELDVSTAVRFHFGEMALSTAWRAAQVLLIGTSPRTLRLWQQLTLLSVMFHHSNVRLPLPWERRIARFVMTPRLHGIHHSIVAEEVNSNWSSGLTVWDWLHGTLRTDVPQDEVHVGVPGFRRAEAVSLGRLLALPFTRAVAARPAGVTRGSRPRIASLRP